MVTVSTLLPIPDRYITFHPHDSKFRCEVCRGRPMKDYSDHISGDSHQQSIARLIDHQQAQQAMLPGLHSTMISPLSPCLHPVTPPEDQWSPSPPPSPMMPLSPLGLLRSFLKDDDAASSSDSDASDYPMNFRSLKQALEALAAFEEGDDGDNEVEEEPEEEDSTADDLIGWYPFKRKEQVVALLIIGNNRSIISRSQYDRIRLIIRICYVNLPAWKTLRELSNRLKTRMGINLIERLSPSGIPLFGLDVKNILKNELANPLVSPHLVFLPELPTNEAINRLSQSKKWREDYSAISRVQMVVSAKKKHIYIYEPVQLQTHQLVVPIFFYQQNCKTMAKCLPADVQPYHRDPNRLQIMLPEDRGFDSDGLYTIDVNDIWKLFHDISVEDALLSDLCQHMYQHSGYDLYSIPLVNPWREKAKGKVIRHMPITLYSDDTSGNVSKKFNKHMSVYFTLAGLAPEWTNQEFNIHFLATSNAASALDLLDEIIDNINNIGENGFLAYDHVLGEEVLVMAVVLCHVGDSPMHAEISNTTNPAITLTPCRICNLQVARQADKKANRYVRDFLGRNDLGQKFDLPGRKWDVTKLRTHEIWNLAKRSNSKTLIEETARAYGQKDTINEFFIKQMQNAHNEDHPTVDVDQLFQQLNEKHGSHLFNPMLRLQGFDGHKDTPFETLHVVLLGIVKYLFRDTMHNLSLKPGSKQFKTFMPDGNHFLSKWVNKPKFHMLVHLKECIQRFGPAILYASEKFESFNFSLRNASVHSNKGSPGKDIGNNFNNQVLLRILLSGSSFFDHELQARVKGGPRLTGLLQQIPQLYAAMGLRRPQSSNEEALYMCGKPIEPQGPRPECLGHNAEGSLQEMKSITLPNGQQIESGDFILLKDTDVLSQVSSVWTPAGLSASKAVLVLKACRRGRIVPFYGMREYLVTEETFHKRVKAVQCLMNVQHNCHEGNCHVGRSSGRWIERRDVGATLPIICHSQSNSFILNSAAHYSAHLHRRLSEVQVSNVSCAQWNEAIERGIETWIETPVCPPKPRAPATQKKRSKRGHREASPESDAEAADSDE
ncbi:hypothetical protein DFH28DRAFT_1138529 [Melampsora americana]|nr:hypothetical protein DFH28DRAFT_1138529 [Melampsora americana]